MGVNPARGALVAGVDDKSPAKPAGISAGDVIASIDGKDIKEMRDLPRIVAALPAGKDVAITFIRQGREMVAHVKLGLLARQEVAVPPPKKDTPAGRPVIESAFGLQLADLTHAVRQRYKIKPSMKGVLITEVDPNSDAAGKGLRVGMVIDQVQTRQVATAAELRQRIEQSKKAGKKAVILRVISPDNNTKFIAMLLH